MQTRGKGSSPGRVEGSSRAMLATARPSCFFQQNSRANTPQFTTITSSSSVIIVTRIIIISSSSAVWGRAYSVLVGCCCSCRGTKTSCVNSDIGCGFHGTRAELQRHIDQCLFNDAGPSVRLSLLPLPHTHTHTHTLSLSVFLPIFTPPARRLSHGR